MFVVDQNLCSRGRLPEGKREGGVFSCSHSGSARKAMVDPILGQAVELEPEPDSTEQFWRL